MTKDLNTTEISAKILQHSITEKGVQIISFELEYPRFIHAEFMTHRVFSRNAASSRAIPISKNIEQVKNRLAHPIHWGVNKPGMQASDELEGDMRINVQQDWVRASQFACHIAERFQTFEAHKQLSNRVLEPFVHMKTVMTTTEIKNFMELRDHKDAQPEIAALARAMAVAVSESEPLVLKEGEYHVPYVDRLRNSEGVLDYFINGAKVSVEIALQVSASACAQVSYRILNLGIEKAQAIYQKLVTGKPVHASPFEHQATPLIAPKKTAKTWPAGVTHLDRNGEFWSGNFHGWLQNRQNLGEF